MYFQIQYDVRAQMDTESYTLRIPLPVDQERRQDILSLRLEPQPSRREWQGDTEFAIYEGFGLNLNDGITVSGKARLRGV